MNWYSPIIEATGNYDPLKFDWIRLFVMSFHREPSNYFNIEITSSYGNGYFIKLRIINVKQMLIGSIDNSTFQFGELFIDDIHDHGMEDINYQICDEINGFSCYCKDIVIDSISKIDHIDTEHTIWTLAREDAVDKHDL